jgi:cyclopropane fatty-acyl-phospholipid synthase-like methyltransferase
MQDPKEIVERGYDRMAERYLEWSDRRPSPVRMWFLGEALARIGNGTDVLDLGCGAGVPMTRALASGRRVTGIDMSERQIELARANVPDATFVRSDFTTMDWPPRSVDAITAFYAFVHVPRAEQQRLLGRIAEWLRPEGALLAQFGSADTRDEVEEGWLGVPMFFAGFAPEHNEDMLVQAGFRLELSEVREEEEDPGEIVRFHHVVARVPA